MWSASAFTLLWFLETTLQHHVSAFVPRGSSSSSSNGDRRGVLDAAARVVGRAGVAGTRVSMTSTDISSPYQPDRDAERTAYESEQGWELKYHDIKTRRDTADARGKVRATRVCVCSVVMVVVAKRC